MPHELSTWRMFLGILAPFVYFMLALLSMGSKIIAAYFWASMILLGVSMFSYQIYKMGWRNFLRSLANLDERE